MIRARGHSRLGAILFPGGGTGSGPGNGGGLPLPALSGGTAPQSGPTQPSQMPSGQVPPLYSTSPSQGSVPPFTYMPWPMPGMPWMPGPTLYPRPIAPPNAGRPGNRPTGGGGRTGPAGSTAPAGGRPPAQAPNTSASQAPQPPLPPPPGAPGGTAPMAPMVGGEGNTPGPQATDTQQGAQGESGATAKGRGRGRLPQMSQRFCINVQPRPIGNGFCPYQNDGCPYVHEIVTGNDVALAQQLGDTIRARQASRAEQGQDSTTQPPGKGRGRGRGRGGGRGQGWQNQMWEQVQVEGGPFGSIMALNLHPFSGTPHQLQ